MLSREKISKVLLEALKSGGDFAEVFVEDTINNNISMSNGNVEKIVSGRDYGVGIRIFKGFKSIYAYINDDSLSSLLNTARKAALAIGDLKEDQNINLNFIERVNKNINPILYVPSYISTDKKIEKLNLAYNVAKSYNNEIVQVTTTLLEKDRKILIANSEGLFTEDRNIRTRLGVLSVASNGKENQTGFQSPGRLMGFEFFDHIDPEYFAREASKTAVTMLHADYCKAGKMTVAIENGFGGVIFHEACGHALEASSVAKGDSVFTNKLGKQIASTKVTALDDGTMPNLWGSINIDDEGVPSERKILIENGILKNYMIDKLNGRRMNMVPNGSSRRESYKFAPTSRMTNTFIANGEDENEDIIKSMSYGLYAKKMGGGSVNPITGEFNFTVAEGYIVENGVIQRPVRGASLIGKGSEILMNIDMVGKNLDHGQGMCGASSGSVPTNVGQPLIRVSEITVGGR
ncbi:microcin-processing peptidase 2. Unknown type peptidase. MEROPS family U62 [Clostridium cavendishii DSM 21758]|uniref:TldD protein n=1 Tax=Clostridium cavendishii DSM 21758 TaxID=1121302 RepID=A0A1M6E908_9CLOT|nr:TldD/PmbA family protein [Clostridium cavendishii]SHI81840.1 microcin-processing peptidase 2. Unknown type peptidase. MEROPS family U62 [Clostridium cavendishii DSM 21758]